MISDKVFDSNHFRTIDNTNDIEWEWSNGEILKLSPSKYYKYHGISAHNLDIIYMERYQENFKVLYVDKMTNYMYMGTTDMEFTVIRRDFVLNGNDNKDEFKQFRKELKLYLTDIIVYNLNYSGFKVLGEPKYSICWQFADTPFDNKKITIQLMIDLSIKKELLDGFDISRFKAIDCCGKQIISIDQFNNSNFSKPVLIMEYIDGEKLYLMPKTFCVDKNGRRCLSKKFNPKNHIINTKSSRKQLREFIKHNKLLSEIGLSGYYNTILRDNQKSARN